MFALLQKSYHEPHRVPLEALTSYNITSATPGESPVVMNDKVSVLNELFQFSRRKKKLTTECFDKLTERPSQIRQVAPEKSLRS